MGTNKKPIPADELFWPLESAINDLQIKQDGQGIHGRSAEILRQVLEEVKTRYIEQCDS